jgi:hypothetical protein
MQRYAADDSSLPNPSAEAVSLLFLLLFPPPERDPHLLPLLLRVVNPPMYVCMYVYTYIYNEAVQEEDDSLSHTHV